VNFENADIREVVQSILGNTLGENYVIDPNVAGSVTVSSARKLTRDELVPALEVILQMNGAALVRDKGHYRVTLEASAVAGTADVGEGQPGYGISILPLRHVSAQTLISLIDGFGARPGSVRAERARNLLVVLGNSADRKAAIETALTFDADWMRDQSVAVLPLQHSKPEAVIPELERIFSSREGGVGSDLVQFIPMQRLRAVLVVSPRNNVIQTARTWVRRLDTEDPDLTADVHVYRVKYRDATKLAGLLNGLFSGQGGTSTETPNGQVEPGSEPITTEGMTSGFSNSNNPNSTQDQQTPGQQQNQPSDLIAGPDTSSGLNPAIVGTPSPGTEGPNGGGVRIQADVANNSLVIFANTEMTQRIIKALERIDVPQLQVAINVTMAELRLTDELRFGIQYYLKTHHGTASLFSGLTNTITQTAPGFNFVFGSAASPDAIIDAFDGITDVQVLSSPSLVVVENEVAKFQVGDQIPIVTRTVTSTENINDVSNEVEYRDTGIILNIKPRIADNGVVTLDIGQEISNVAAGGNTLTPTISNRAIKSSIAVVDGQTVMLGGLIGEAGARERAGVPGVSRVPGIGYLFGRRRYANQRTELIILIKPSVIRGSEDAQHVADDLRSRLWGLGATQAR
jgi:general secretion pathway protein D